MMNRRRFLGAVSVSLLAAPLAAEAQRSATGTRVAFVGAESPGGGAAFRSTLPIDEAPPKIHAPDA